MKTVTIGGKEYKVKYSLRSLFIFEAITKKPFTIDTLTDNYLFFYSILLASNPDMPLDWDAFIDELDSNPNLFNEINEAVTEQQKGNKLLDSSEEKNEGEGKKK